MKLFTAPSTDSLVRILLAAGVALCVTSCVTQPEPAAPPPEAAAAEVAVAPEPERAQILEPLRLAPPRGPQTIAGLPEPESPPIMTVPTAVPTDITVLSRIKDPSVAPAALPEPLPPVRAEPAAIAVAPVQAAKPTTPAAPVTPKPAPQKPAPATTAEAKPVEAKPAEPKPTAAKPAEAPATQAAEPPKAAIALPPAPSSSARSVVAAQPKPVAETRLETVRGERFELRFPGSGWIYLGDEEGKEGLRYETRRFEDTQAIFALNPESPGEYLLRFQRENPVDRSTETSLVRVVVADKAAAPAAPAVAAPAVAASAAPSASAETPSASPPASSTASAASVAPTEPAVAASSPASALSASPAPLPTDPAELMRLAKAELEAKRAQAAIGALDRYLSLYPVGNDELFYLYGLAFEQDTPFRNIKKAYENYRRVKDEYPRSLRWREAADRVAFLERHYFGLR